MAQRRMFSQKIVDSDAFLEMPTSSQLLYFHLVMRADDEGFVGSPKRIMKMIGFNDDDLKILIAKRFILTFESGVVVIKHWLIHNTIRMDRFESTSYQNERKQLKTNENKAYTEIGNQMATKWQPLVVVSKDKLSKDKLREGGAIAPSPSQITKNFFSNPEPIIKELISKGLPENIVRTEINKFINYWTELNKSGTKQRWEKQPTFEVNRRLTTWFNKAQEFNKNESNIINLMNL